MAEETIDEREPFGTEDEGTTDEATAEEIARAKDLGWQENYSGDKPKKTAREYLNYAEEALPVIKANNQKLMKSLNERDQTLTTLQNELAEQKRILKALTEDSEAASKQRQEGQLDSLKAQLIEANREGDFEAVAEIQERMLDLKTELKALKQKPVEQTSTQQATVPKADPVFAQWLNENTWMKDEELAAAASTIGARLVREATSMGEVPPRGRVLLDKVAELMDNKFHVLKGSTVDKVDGGSNSSGTGRSSSKSGRRYAELPREAREACEAQAHSRVGPGKRYAKLEDWQKRFTEIYNQG
jgi:hypothetical protein